MPILLAASPTAGLTTHPGQQSWNSGFPLPKSVTSLALTTSGNNNTIQAAHLQTLEASSSLISGKSHQPQLLKISWILPFHSTYTDTTKVPANTISCLQYCNNLLTGPPTYILHPIVYRLHINKGDLKSKQNKNLVKSLQWICIAHEKQKKGLSLAWLVAAHFLDLISYSSFCSPGSKHADPCYGSNRPRLITAQEVGAVSAAGNVSLWLFYGLSLLVLQSLTV